MASYNPRQHRLYKNKMSSFIFCSFFPVGLNDYIKYFKRKFDNFLCLEWKFPHSSDKFKQSSYIKFYKGNIINQKKLFSYSLARFKLLYFVFLPLNYFIYLGQALHAFRNRYGSERVVFMGVNFFCTLCGLILKKLGKVDIVIYRVMDFFPLPKSGPYRFYNRFFYWIDKYCLYNSDWVLFTTEGHIKGREQYGYFKKSDIKEKIRMIPLGVDSQNTVSFKINNVNKLSLLYCGVISKYQMLDLIFNVIDKLRIKYPQIKVDIVGVGPDFNYYKNLSKKKSLDKNIVFWGYMDESREFSRFMGNHLLGFALYEDKDDYIKYTEPAKVKYYLNFGVPALISEVPFIARDFDQKKLSFAVKNDINDICQKIEGFLRSGVKQNEYKNNIRRFMAGMDINILLDNVLKGIV